MKKSGRSASRSGTATRRCGLALSAALTACALGVTSPPKREPADRGEPRIHVYAQQPPSADERYCAWYGEAADGVLYFGEAAFWSSSRAAGNDPRADLRKPGPRRIGRFDLELRQMLEPLETGPRHDGLPTRSGVWDVLPRRGRVFFTSYLEEAGYVDLETRSVHRFQDSALWNELAEGPVISHHTGFSTIPQETLLVTRYADHTQGGGAVLVVDPDGEILRTLPLAAPEGTSLAAKTAAWDPVMRQIWVTTDRLPLPPAGSEHEAFAHPALVLDLDGNELARFGTSEEPLEIQFVRFNNEGIGFLAVHRAGRLGLTILKPAADRRRLATTPTVILDENFATGFDFAQDIQIGRDGRVVLTRWSGAVHEVQLATRQLRSWQLPREDDALYYSAVPAGLSGAICATRCGDVEVVCASPAAPGTR